MKRKAQPLRELSPDELQEKVLSLRKDLYDLRSRQARKELEGGLAIRNTRRELARVMTILTEKRKASAASSAS